MTQPPLLETRKLVADGRYQDALAVISREIEAFPDWAEPWALMGHVFSRLSRFGEALSACDQAIARDPWNLNAQQLKTALLLQLNNSDAALDAAKRLVSLERTRVESHLFLSFAYSFTGHEVEAIEEANICKKLEPRRGIHHQAFCMVHMRAKRWDMAERHAVAALQGEGPSAGLFNDLGLILDRQGRYDEARTAYATAVRLDPRFEPVLARFNRRRLVPTRGLPVAICIALGALLIPMSVPSLTLACIASMAAIAMTVMALRPSARTTRFDALTPQ